MAISLPIAASEDVLNTVAVVPFDLVPATTPNGRARSSSSSLAAAASNLISAIAQGSALSDPAHAQQAHYAASADGSDEGSSSFTYTAPANTTGAEDEAWYASTPYHISNRYYDADITLKATKAALSSSSPSSIGQTFPAYLVVVDRSRSLEFHRRLAASLESRVAPGFDADISIVAGVSLLSSDSTQLVTAADDERNTSSSRTRQGEKGAKTSDLVALYADAGWEFIAIDEMGEDESSDGDSFNDDVNEDTDGIERIREALMNHMWHGLERKDHSAARRGRQDTNGAGAKDVAVTSSWQGFSDSITTANEQDADTEQAERAGSPASFHEAIEPFPPLSQTTHAETTALDEQLAALFLSSTSTRSDDLAQLEAFLESQDPSWPGAQASAPEYEAVQFDDDFSPFQSGSADNAEDLPSNDEIENMQARLFGRRGDGDQDLAQQLQQLQWHADRVRAIADPEQRSKEAALIAMAFGMQWDNEHEGTVNDVGVKLAF